MQERRVDIVLNAARQRCLDRLEHANGSPDALDVLVVGQWLWEERVTRELIPSTIRQAVQMTLAETPKATGAKAAVQRYGPYGIGAGGFGALIAVIEALTRLLRT